MSAIEDLKKKTAGMPDEVVITLTTQQAKALLDQLEAERQRAAGSEEELHKALHREKAVERKLLAAQEEIVALKGEQVPVALVDERQGSGGFCLTQFGQRLNLQHGTELFTAPQKPVVCLKSGYLHKSEAIDAIEAAGCVVSFSDERLMQDMSGIVKDGE